MKWNFFALNTAQLMLQKIGLGLPERRRAFPSSRPRKPNVRRVYKADIHPGRASSLKKLQRMARAGLIGLQQPTHEQQIKHATHRIAYRNARLRELLA